MPETFPFIIASAQVDITMGTPFINDLQNLYAYLLKGKSEIDAEAIRTKLEQKAPLEDWEAAIITMTSLINKIHNNARLQNQVIYQPLEDAIKANLGAIPE